MSLDPDQFYTGIVSEHYDLLVPEDEFGARGFYRGLVERDGTPALELGCGTGRPLLDFVADGLDVEGLDSSGDMLRECRRKAAERSLSVRLHHARMESFEIARCFRMIFVVGPSFTLVVDSNAVRSALECCWRHLVPGGRLVVPLHLETEPVPSAFDDWQVTREETRARDGATIRCSRRMVLYDREAGLFEAILRYEVLRGGRVAQCEDRPFAMRMHTQDRFASLLAGAGFDSIRAVRGDGSPSLPDDPAFVFLATRPGRRS